MYRFWFLFPFVGHNNIDVFILYRNTLDIDILDVWNVRRSEFSINSSLCTANIIR